MAQITIPVPDDRLADFYRQFADWLGETASTNPSPTAGPWYDQPGAAEIASRIWSYLSPNARVMFDLMIEAPDEPFSPSDFAEAADLENGGHGVAGVLGRAGAAVKKAGLITDGWHGVWNWDRENYSMDPGAAALFKSVRGY
ncbi:DUF6416 domain-containing protein [Agromyces sp. NPDC057679]|uniref:DUF6416 domain-containing protein n=1 Tax=Agromyces sp. NPDC057679 TaxID=3346207 RepID=UPI00366E7670